VLVREGDHVSAGQLLAIIDNRPQQAQARSAGAAETAAQAQARQAELAARYARDEHAGSLKLARLVHESALAEKQTGVAQAEAALKSAEAELQKARAGARPQEIAQAEQSVRQTKATRERATTELERVRFLFEKGISAKRQFEDAQTALAVADSALETARQQLSLIRAGTRPEDLRTAELKVDQEKAALAQVRAAAEAKVAQTRASLRQAEQAVLQVEVKRQEAQAARSSAVAKGADFAAALASAHYAELRSPISGVVTKRALNPGDLADPAAAVVEVSDTRTLDLTATLPADSATAIRAGMPAHMTSVDLHGMKTLVGRVISVGQIDPQTNLLSIRISVPNARGMLKVGGFAAAGIVVRRNPSAIVVPKDAVVTKEGKTVIYIAGADGKAIQKDSIVGTEQDDNLEILNGARAGDKVIVQGQYELTDGAKIKLAEDKELEGAKKDGGKKAGD
jgi:HlyD family secretion protein